MKNLKIAILLGLIFFIFGLLTLSDYGISWDEPNHFNRGQAYLWYFLTGNQNYSNLPPYNLKEALNNLDYHERSFYQLNSLNMEVWLDLDGEHPPLNDILASLTNYLFYQKLGLVGDIEGYHLFNIFISSVLVAVVFLFAAESFGVLAGSFAALFIATYPLFFGESRFNIKDPAQTTFIVLTLYFFWKAVNLKKAIYIFISSIFAGMALGVKFNILFLAPVLGIWVLINIIFDKNKKTFKFILNKKTILILIIFPFIMFSILIITWPFLYLNTTEKIINIFRYYKDIGIQGGNSQILFGVFKPYASIWILFTTPPFMLLFFISGVLVGVKKLSKKNFVILLWILFFVVTIFRVSLPKTNIYGGVRQIMEYIPAMCLIAGVGASWFVKTISKKLRINLELVSIFTISIVSFFLIIPLVKLHPNQNVYFNFLIGGLKGAVEKKIPSAGNSFGNTYLQGIRWLNENLKEGDKIALVQGTGFNIPLFQIGEDLKFNNSYWSAIERKGEYLMEVTYNQEFRAYYYAWEYVEKMLEPVYEVKADGVAILKIWENDLAHTKKEYRKPEVVYLRDIDFKVDKNTFLISLPEEVLLTRVSISFSHTPLCLAFKNGSVETSKDGKQWFKELDPVSLYQFGSRENYKENTFEYLFAAREAKYIKITIKEANACILNSPKIELRVLQ